MMHARSEPDAPSAPRQGSHPERRATRAPSGRIRTITTDVPGLDPKALAAELRAALDGEVRFDDGSRAL